MKQLNILRADNPEDLEKAYNQFASTRINLRITDVKPIVVDLGDKVLEQRDGEITVPDVLYMLFVFSENPR